MSCNTFAIGWLTLKSDVPDLHASRPKRQDERRYRFNLVAALVTTAAK